MTKALGLGWVLVFAGIAVIVWIQNSQITPTYENYHYAYNNELNDYTGITKPDKIQKIKEKVFGMIVSHHFYVERDISNSFAKISDQDIKTIVIVGPEHFGTSKFDVSVTKNPYHTPFGVVEPDLDVINSLLEGGVFLEPRPFADEHSISTLVGMVEYYFPDAKIVPIIISRKIGMDGLEDLSDKLNSILPENSLVIASVDFSHHQNRITANYHDSKSISVLESFDFTGIEKLEVDSPQSLFVLEKYLEKRGAQRMSYTRTDQAEVSGNLASEDVTSYLFAHFTKGEPEVSTAASVMSFGDMMLGREVGAKISEGLDPFEKIKGVEGNFLRGVDMFTANLEGVITSVGNCAPKPVVLKFEPLVTKLMKKNKIGSVSLANNHSYDCGEVGLEDTKKLLKESGVRYFTDTEPVIVKAGNKKLAQIGFSLLGASEYDLKMMEDKISTLKRENDYVIVYTHWGLEYNSQPSSEQKEIAYKIIDAGADAIIGSHPHVVQPLEIYSNKPIFYSLGNFIFDQPLPETNIGLGVGLVFKEQVIEAYLFPYQINNFQPTLMGYDESIEKCKSITGKPESGDSCIIKIKQ